MRMAVSMAVLVITMVMSVLAVLFVFHLVRIPSMLAQFIMLQRPRTS
jgi:hypothetical protein